MLSNQRNGNTGFVNRVIPVQSGAEWSPGHPLRRIPSKFIAVQPEELIKRKVGDALINWFLYESPRADEVMLVKDSLQLMDEPRQIWKAAVHTLISYKFIEPRQHISWVRFRVVCLPNKLDKIKDRYVIANNQITFI